MKPVIKLSEVPMYEAPPGYPQRSTCVLIDKSTVGAEELTLGFFVLPPGKKSVPDVHEFAEAYYVTRGRGYLLLDGKKYAIEKDTAIYIAPGVKHQSFNIGDEELWIIWFFPCHPKFWKHEVEEWIKK